MKRLGCCMATEQRSDDASVIAVLRTEIRERPVLLISFILFVSLVSLLIPYAEIHDADGQPVGQAADSTGRLTAAVDFSGCVGNQSVLDEMNASAGKCPFVRAPAGLNLIAFGVNLTLLPEACAVTLMPFSFLAWPGDRDPCFHAVSTLSDGTFRR
jgi:hypothetical protein